MKTSLKDIMGQDIITLRQYYMGMIANSIIANEQYLEGKTPIGTKKKAAREIIEWADALVEEEGK